MPIQYGELRPTISRHLLASLGHPNKFQWVSRLGSVTARHSSNGHQPNFAVLNRGRHLYSAERPSRWALTHILVLKINNEWIVLTQTIYTLFKFMHLFTNKVAYMRMTSCGLAVLATCS